MRYQDLRNGRFYNEDCFDAMATIPDGVVDMILCDLPYGTTACKWDSIIPFGKLWAEYRRIVKDNSAIVLTSSQPFTSALIASNFDNYKYNWVWNKAKAANFPLAKRQPLKIHEDVCIFSKGKGNYTPIMTDGVMRKKGGHPSEHEQAISAGTPAKVNDKYYPKSILDFSIADNKEAGFHPTQKPVALFEYLIKTYTNEGQLVLDNTAGSGTTAIAAINTNRKWVCIERDEIYADKAIERIKKHDNETW
jgi:site-specific DNA-methyltransferase (adenine-specific)